MTGGDRSVVGRQLVAWSVRRAHILRNPLPELGDIARQLLDLLLLTEDRVIQLVQKVLGEAGLDFQVGHPLFDVLWCFHGAIGPERHGTRQTNAAWPAVARAAD